MARRAGNFLKAYQEYTKESESPESFHLFCGLSIISSAVRRHVWLDQGIYLLYPNLYVVLVGPPGRTAKSTAIRMARTLLYAVPGINLGPDSVTREELIRVLAGSHAGDQSALTIHSTELSSLIEPSGIKMIQFLTDIYDCDYSNPKGWQYSTKGSGKDEIKNPHVVLLGATTPSYIAEGLPERVTSHGFTARILFVYEEKNRFQRPWPKPPDPQLVAALKQDLVLISQLKGIFRWSEPARDYYREYYEKVHKTEPSDHRVEGFHWRKHRSHILKLAMLCSMAEKDELLLEMKDLEAAEGILNLIEPKMARTFQAVGKYEHALDLERLLAQVAEEGGEGISQAELLRRNYFIGSLSVLEEMLSSLIVMGLAKREGRGESAIVKVTSHGLKGLGR